MFRAALSNKLRIQKEQHAHKKPFAITASADK